MCALVIDEGEVTFRPALPDTAPLKSAMWASAADEGDVTFRPAVPDAAPLEVGDMRSSC